MVEEQKGTEAVGDAGQQEAGNNDAAAGVQQGDTQDAAGNQEVEGLKAAAVAERKGRQEESEKRQAAETEAQSLRDQMALMQPAQAQPQKQTSLSQAVAKELGIDIEIATPEEICQINEGVLQITSGQQSEQSFINSHPDYAKVVGTTLPNGQFQAAPPLLRAMKANPVLADALRNSPNKAVLAYASARNDPQYLTELAEAAKSDDTKAAEIAKAKIEAANKQLSISNAKTGGGNLDDAARRQAQTDEEFLAENEQIMAKAT